MLRETFYVNDTYKRERKVVLCMFIFLVIAAVLAISLVGGTMSGAQRHTTDRTTFFTQQDVHKTPPSSEQHSSCTEQSTISTSADGGGCE